MLLSLLMPLVSAAAFKKVKGGEVKVVKATSYSEPDVVFEITGFKKYAKVKIVGTCQKFESLAEKTCTCTLSKASSPLKVTCGKMKAPNELSEHVFNDQGCFVYISPLDFKNGLLDSNACQTFYSHPKGYETDFAVVPVPRTSELGVTALVDVRTDSGPILGHTIVHPDALSDIFFITCWVVEKEVGNTCSCRMALLPIQTNIVIQCPPTYEPSKTVPDDKGACRLYINTPLLGLQISDLEKTNDPGRAEICHTFDRDVPKLLPRKWRIEKRAGDVSFTIHPNAVEQFNGAFEHKGAETLFHATCTLASTPNSRCQCSIQAAKLSAQDIGPFYEPIECGVMVETEVLTVDQCYLHINPTLFMLLKPTALPDGRPLRPPAAVFDIGKVCFTTLHENGKPRGIADESLAPSLDPLTVESTSQIALDLSSLVPSTNGRVIAVKPIDILAEIPAEGESRTSWFREHTIKLNYGHKVVPICNIRSSQCGCMVYHVENNAFDICKNPLKLIHVQGGNCHLLLKRKALAEIACTVVPRRNSDKTFLMKLSLIEDPPLKKPELMKLKPIPRPKS